MSLVLGHRSTRGWWGAILLLFGTSVATASNGQADSAVYARFVDLSGRSDVPGLLLLGVTLSSSGDPQDAYLGILSRAVADFRSDRLAACAQRLDSLGHATPQPEHRLLAVAHKFRAGILDRTGDRRSGMEELEAGLALADSARLPMERTDLLVMKAEFLFADEANEEALRFLHDAQRMAERTGYARGLCMVRINLGNFRYAQERWDDAWQDYQAALGLATAGGFDLLAESCANNLGAVAASSGRFDLALHLFDSLAHTLGDQRLSFKAALLGQIGYIQDMKGDHERALELFHRAIALSDSLGDTRGAADTRQYLSSALWETGHRREAIAERRKVLEAMIAAGDGRMQVETRWILWEWYEAIGDKDAALREARIMSLLDDSLEHVRYNDRLALSEVRFETERKERRIVEQQQALLLADSEKSRKSAQRDLAIAGAAVIGILAIFLIDRRRRKARHEQEQAVLRERLRIADDLHDDLGAGLSTLRMRGELALRRTTDPAHRETLTSFSNLADDLSRNMRDILWAMTTEQTGSKHLAEHLVSRSREFLSGSGITLHAEVGELPERRVSAECRRNLPLVLKEVLNNTLKHAGAHNVHLDIAWKNGLELVVRDDGTGIPAQAGAGNGMRTIRQRIGSLGGTTLCQAAPGGGTEWHFHVPLPEGNERSIGTG